MYISDLLFKIFNREIEYDRIESFIKFSSKIESECVKASVPVRMVTNDYSGSSGARPVSFMYTFYVPYVCTLHDKLTVPPLIIKSSKPESRSETTVNSCASIGDFQRLMRNLNCGLNAAMSSAAKFYDGTREVRAIGILRFSPREG